MKRLMMIAAIALAANFVAFDIQPASANDAHHPAQATKSKKVKVHTKGKVKSVKSSKMQMMKCRMMSESMMQGGMMQGGMMQGGMMQGGMMKGGMKCPMMSAGKMRRMGMMQNMGSNMGPGMMGASGMRHGEVMMGHRNPCWVMNDRERNFGYQGACNH